MEVALTPNYAPKRKIRSNSLPERWNRLLFWFSFFMAFPAIVIVQNVTLYIFAGMLFFLFRYSGKSLVTLNKPIQWAALFFGFGAILSVLNIPEGYAFDSLERALAVLPNYIYWSFLLIVMVTHRQRMDLEVVYKAVFWGVISLIGYYLFFQNYLTFIPLFAPQSPNSFAFLMICFSPIAIYYISKIKGKPLALALLIVFILILLLEGRRAGMVLVLLTGLGTLFIRRIHFRQIFFAGCLIPLFYALLYTPSVEHLILGGSERIHQMIYETEKIQKEDISYLTRVAMINKGLAIYERYPYTGIGLNNFNNFNVLINRDFEGAGLVVNRAGINQKSAHNSYIAILAEGGLFLLIPFLLIIGSLILYFIVHINVMQEYKRPIFWGVLGMSIHLYFISAIVNVFAWFLIGLACALVSRKH